MSKHISMSVAELLSLHIEGSGMNQTEIAEAVGFERPNIITMIKQGKTKLPLAKIGPMARALRMDPIGLFAAAMSEYQPETWEAIESLSSQPLLTENERTILSGLRKVGLPMTKIPDSDVSKIAAAVKAALPLS